MADLSPKIPPMTHDDAVFVNALAVLFLPVVQDAARDDAWRDVAEDARGRANCDHPMLAPLIDAYGAWISAQTVHAVEGARLRLVARLAEFFVWRGAQACAARDAAREEGCAA